MAPPRNYQEWEAQVATCIKKDALWTITAYRKALFLAELAWEDSSKLRRNEIARPIAGQLFRAVGSIGANIAEGYGRYGRRDRAHFYEYALGSARESRHWYLQGHHALGADVVNHRLIELTEITRLLIRYIGSSRADSAPTATRPVTREPESR
jgi:four helix bundle protein